MQELSDASETLHQLHQLHKLRHVCCARDSGGAVTPLCVAAAVPRVPAFACAGCFAVAPSSEVQHCPVAVVPPWRVVVVSVLGGPTSVAWVATRSQAITSKV